MANLILCCVEQEIEKVIHFMKSTLQYDFESLSPI